MEATRTNRYLPVELTTFERVEFGKKLAQLHSEYAKVEAEKKAAADGFKDDLENIDGRMAHTAMIVRNGYETREVECEWRYDFPANKKELVRMDTGEIVETQTISADERQLMLQMDQNQAAFGELVRDSAATR